MASIEQGKDASKAEQPAFNLPVDSECKATTIKLFSLARPHMRAFHLAWFNFFMTFLATFAPAALLPLIREDLSLTKTEAGNAGVAAVCGAVVARMGMGTVLDILGPRLGNAITLLLFAPPVFCMSLAKTATDFTILRLFIGCSLCCFVCCQFWVGSMFNVRIVGTANAITAGWGNMGGGAVAIIMPVLVQGLNQSVPLFTAWRWAFFIPGAIFLIMGAVTLAFGVDSPRGDFRDLKRQGILAPAKGSFWAVIMCAISNYRTWVLALNYGYSFGVELTVDNIIVTYLFDQFEMNLVTAGGIGALFGLMNLFSRASGGMLSDLAAARWGMRGRLWTLFIIQLLAGAFCLVLGKVDYTLGGTIAVMIIFSIFCQQACGAMFGVVPFVSRRSYGVVSGVVGAGGNVGAIVTQVIFFAGSVYSPTLSTQDGLTWMGVMIMAVTSTLALVHWPMWGSMFLPARTDVTEEDYYIREWSADDIASGLHSSAMAFAVESRSQRGSKANMQVAAAKVPMAESVQTARTSDLSTISDEVRPMSAAVGR